MSVPITEKSGNIITSKTCSTKSIDWNIPDFFLSAENINNGMRSPSFSFFGRKWFLQIFPNGETNGTEGRVVVSLFCEVIPPSAIRVDYQLGLKKQDGSECLSVTGEFEFGNEINAWCRELCKHTTLYKYKNENILENAVTVFCVMSVKNAENEGKTSLISSFEKYTLLKLKVRKKIGSVHGNFLPDVRPAAGYGPGASQVVHSSSDEIGTNDCAKRIEREDFQQMIKEDSEQETEVNTAGVDKLLQDIKNLFYSGEESDVTVKVAEQEFRVHKAILAARSAVFSSMFKHDTIEKRTAIVQINDFDPDTIREFLAYLYMGKCDTILEKNAFDLYRIADMYDTRELKTACLKYMTDNLSVESICDVVVLALQHGESTLLENATKFFTNNIKKIILTTKWQIFHKDCPVESNELLIKAMNHIIPE